jgi:hypothetical protein
MKLHVDISPLLQNRTYPNTSCRGDDGLDVIGWSRNANKHKDSYRSSLQALMKIVNISPTESL